jgi:uncharacterized protein YndB with AHSA1/START domain
MTATREGSVFRQAVQVSVGIQAPPEAVWRRLTDAEGFSTWNSTVERIDGPIELGRRLAIRVPAAPGRAFRPKVVEFEPPRRMTWRDGALPMFRGTRTFTVEPEGVSASRFTMREEFRGVMLPVIARSLPDFAPIFDRYADDLKAACEVVR